MKPLKGVIFSWNLDERGRICGMQIFGSNSDETTVCSIETSEVVKITTHAGNIKIAETANSCYVLV